MVREMREMEKKHDKNDKKHGCFYAILRETQKTQTRTEYEWTNRKK